jgi:membrane associated rhomboid family serine protease
MFPIGDNEVRGAGPGVLTIGLVVINVIVFLFEATMGQQELQQFINTYGVIPAEITQGYNLGTLFTSMFLHGGWMHLISNMLYLWVFGDNIEHVLGEIGYIIFYLVGGLAASAAHILFNLNSQIPSVGASGAIAAVLGAYLVMFPKSRVRVLLFTGYGMGVRRVTALIFLGIWAVSQLFSGLASLGAETAQTGGVAVWAHIGGFVFGLIIGFFFKSQADNLQFERT